MQTFLKYFFYPTIFFQKRSLFIYFMPNRKGNFVVCKCFFLEYAGELRIFALRRRVVKYNPEVQIKYKNGRSRPDRHHDGATI
jgi:hypothetical protein